MPQARAPHPSASYPSALPAARLAPLLAASALLLAACDSDDPTRAHPDATAVFVSPPPSIAPAAETLPEPITLRITRNDRPLVGVVVEWSTGEGSGQVDPANSATDTDGRASATWTLAPKAGPQTLVVTPRGLDPIPVTVDAQPGPVSSLSVLWDPGDEPRVVGSTTVDPVVIQAEDQWGNPVPGLPVEWSALPGSGGMTPLAGGTDGDGRAAAHWTFGLEGGTHTARVTVDGALSHDIQVEAALGVRRYSVTEIPAPAGSELSLRRMNSAGIAVGFLRWEPWRETAVVWDGLTLQEMETPPGRNSRVLDINEDGQLLLDLFEGETFASAYSADHRLFLRTDGQNEELAPPEGVSFHGPALGSLLSNAGDVFAPELSLIEEDGYSWVLFTNGSGQRFRTADAPVHLYGGTVTPMAMNRAGDVLLIRRDVGVDHLEVINAYTAGANARGVTSGRLLPPSQDLNDAGVMAVTAGGSGGDGEYRITLVHPERGELLHLGEGILGRGPPSAALNAANQAIMAGGGDPGPRRALFWEEGRGLFRIELDGTDGEVRSVISFTEGGSFLAVLESPERSSAGPAILTPQDP